MKKRLHLLKPDIRKGFLRDGAGQPATCLNIRSDMCEKMLKEDIAAGAVQFQPILDLVKKKPSRFVVVEANNEEQGMLAISYLAGIYNEKEKAFDMEIEDDLKESDSVSPDRYEERDYEEEMENIEEGIRDYDFWEESAYKIPIIDVHELRQGCGRDDHDFIFGPRNYTMGGCDVEKPPYWLNCRDESICIKGVLPYGMSLGDVELLERFVENRHVYLLVIHTADDEVEEIEEEMEDMSYNFVPEDKVFVCRVMLSYTARITKVTLEEKKKMTYYRTLFDSWVEQCGFTLEKRFPKERVIKSILSLYEADKSQLIEKVLRYVTQDVEEGTCLNEKHFEALNSFSAISKQATPKKAAKLRIDKDLVGMEEVKQQINDIVQVMKYNKKREAMGIKNASFHNVHMMIGAPGTAKTTMAELLGNIMCEEHLLPGMRFVSVNGADLKGMYVGHSAPKTHSLFENNDIIFIDEAYSVASSDMGGMDSFGQEAIAQLIIELEKHATDKLVIFAGYGGPNVSEKDNKMKEFLDANPGIKSRINTTIYFDSYTPDEMVAIFHRQAENMNYVLDKKVDELVRNYFEERSTKRDFGNGREARSLLEQCLLFAARRVMNLPEKFVTKKMMKEISYEDVCNAIAKQRRENQYQMGTKTKCGFLD